MARKLPIPNGRLDGALDANGMRIVNLADPLSDDDAATKGYVDSHGGGGGGGGIDLAGRNAVTKGFSLSDGNAFLVAYDREAKAWRFGGVVKIEQVERLDTVLEDLGSDLDDVIEDVNGKLSADDVVPKGSGTQVIATIGGKDIKAPAGGGGGSVVESVANQGYAANADFATEAGTASYATKSGSAELADKALSVTWGGVTDRPSSFQPSKHAGSHKTGGIDPLTAEDVGAIPNGGSADGLRVGPVVLDRNGLWIGYDTWGGEVPGGGSWDMISRYNEGEVETLPGYLAANYAAADQVEAIAESVSTDNRLLIGGARGEATADMPTTAAIQTREGEGAEFADEFRMDKGYDALQGTEMVKLDKSVQTVTVNGGTLAVVFPDAVDGTVRDLCVYANNVSDSDDTVLTFPAGTYYGDDPNGAVAKAKQVTGIYLTEMPGGGFMLSIRELEQHKVEATA